MDPNDSKPTSGYRPLRWSTIISPDPPQSLPTTTASPGPSNLPTPRPAGLTPPTQTRSERKEPTPRVYLQMPLTPTPLLIENYSGIPWSTEQDLLQSLIYNRSDRDRLLARVCRKKAGLGPEGEVHLDHPLLTTPIVVRKPVRDAVFCALLRERLVARLQDQKESRASMTRTPPLPQNDNLPLVSADALTARPYQGTLTSTRSLPPPALTTNKPVIPFDRHIPFEPDNSLAAYDWDSAKHVYAYLLAKPQERENLLAEVGRRISHQDDTRLCKITITHSLIPQGININIHTTDVLLKEILQTRYNNGRQ